MLEEITNYLKLSESLSTAGQPSEEQIEEIAQAGFAVVINLARTGTDYSLEDEAASVLELGMEYIHLPVIWEAPSLSNLEVFFAVMDALKGQRIFLHCAANMRVSAFVALFRILRLGWAREQAFAEMQRIWTPNETWQAFIDLALSGRDG
jgi:uncharacterized protein (TIGR01244 family)